MIFFYIFALRIKEYFYFFFCFWLTIRFYFCNKWLTVHHALSTSFYTLGRGLSQALKSLPWSCWLHYCWHRPGVIALLGTHWLMFNCCWSAPPGPLPLDHIPLLVIWTLMFPFFFFPNSLNGKSTYMVFMMIQLNYKIPFL